MKFAKIAAIGLMTVLALGACSKSSDTSSSQSAAPSAGTSADAKAYQTNCSSCHQMTGAGVPGTFPPLAGNAIVTGDPAKLIHIVKFGLAGKITVNGADYNGMMPAWGQQISNADMASAITYIRSAWGNNASAVTEADVAAAKK